jgi:hypothetical protein
MTSLPKSQALRRTRERSYVRRDRDFGRLVTDEGRSFDHIASLPTVYVPYVIDRGMRVTNAVAEYLRQMERDRLRDTDVAEVSQAKPLNSRQRRSRRRSAEHKAKLAREQHTNITPRDAIPLSRLYDVPITSTKVVQSAKFGLPTKTLSISTRLHKVSRERSHSIPHETPRDAVYVPLDPNIVTRDAIIASQSHITLSDPTPLQRGVYLTDEQYSRIRRQLHT